VLARRNAAILLAILSAGCQRRSAVTVHVIDRIEVASAGAADSPALNLSPAELREALAKALRDSKQFTVSLAAQKPGQKKPALHCRLEVAFAREAQAADSPVGAEVGVSLELRPAGQPERYEATGLGRHPLEPGKPAERVPAFRKALQAALARAVEGEVFQLTALEKADAQLIQDLSAQDPRVRECAAAVLADRRNAAAVPVLIERLRDPDREVALRSVGALGAIGDPRAVAPLIEMTQGKDAQFVLSVLEVVASIGGKDAEAYLFTLASGHPDDEVRDAAQAAQERLRERAAAAGPLGR
jgi:HEAT repeat protein